MADHGDKSEGAHAKHKLAHRLRKLAPLSSVADLNEQDALHRAQSSAGLSPLGQQEHRAVNLIGASLPRSGHHYLAALLEEVLGSDFAYCGGGNMNRCCGELFCNRRSDDAPVFYRKSHDERLDLPTGLSDVYYVVQHRAPVGRMLSFVEQQKRRKGRAFPIDDRKFATRLLALDAVYSVDFCRKWVATPPSNAIVIDYADLASTPTKVLASLLTLIGHPTAEEMIILAVAKWCPMRIGGIDDEDYVPRDEALHLGIPGDLLVQYEALVRSEVPGIWADRPVPDNQRSEVRQAYQQIRLSRRSR